VATTTPVDIGTLIYSRPDLHSGRPCLAGSGMTVHAVVIRYRRGMSAEEIQDQFPHLDISLFYAALTYYFANRAQIDADLDADARLFDELEARYPNGWGPDSVPVE
jgi:uncharacterized protein (DUF433 family)